MKIDSDVGPRDGSPAGPGRSTGLTDYVASIDRFNASQPNAPMLDDIRAYNHQMVGEFNKIRPLGGSRLLDIGASPHGYAMEKCFSFGVADYVGIGLDIESPEDHEVEGSLGRLRYMNAEQMAFEDGSFDLVLSMSTFEHIAHVPKALAEIHRVLRVGGSALVSFEPLWTCPYGHHLHHFGAISDLVPGWAHLVWDRDRMRSHLEANWPSDAPLGVEQAVSWIYDDDVINRVPITQMRGHFASCPLQVEWMLPMMHDGFDRSMLAEAGRATGLSTEDLCTKGLSVLLNKVA
jgi:SAM-dependent methyltransferase